MWTMFVETWKTPTMKYESERKQFKNDRKTITTSKCQGNPIRRQSGMGTPTMYWEDHLKETHQPWTGPYSHQKNIRYGVLCSIDWRL